MNNSEKLRKLLLDSTSRCTEGHDEVALCLSGGIDSASLLYCLLELNKEITCYTFYLENYISSDLKSARRLSKKHDIPLVEVEIPRKNIKKDLITLAKYGCNKKVFFETKVHLLYLFPQIKQKLVLNGEEADMWNGNLKSVAIRGKNQEVFNKMRLEEWDYYRDVDFKINENIAKDNGLILKSPYFDKDILNFYLQFDWYYLNKPTEKWMTLQAFKEYFKEDGYRKQSSYQKNSGMREYMGTFLFDNTINVNNRKSMMGVYMDIYKKYGEPVK